MDGLGNTSNYITNTCAIMVIQHIYGEKPLYLGNERNKKDRLFQIWSMEAGVY